MYGIPSHVQSGIVAKGFNDYECWLKTGNDCQLKAEPLFDYVICSGGASTLEASKIYNLHNGNVYTAGGV